MKLSLLRKPQRTAAVERQRRELHRLRFGPADLVREPQFAIEIILSVAVGGDEQVSVQSPEIAVDRLRLDHALDRIDRGAVAGNVELEVLLAVDLADQLQPV